MDARMSVCDPTVVMAECADGSESGRFIPLPKQRNWVDHFPDTVRGTM